MTGNFIWLLTDWACRGRALTQPVLGADTWVMFGFTLCKGGADHESPTSFYGFKDLHMKKRALFGHRAHLALGIA